MEVQERVRLCLILEKMERQKECSKKLGLENRSCFRGKPLAEKGGKK